MSIELTDIERLTLANQYRILALLSPSADEKASRETCAEIFERGYTQNYSVAFGSVKDWGHFPEDKCQFVVDVLNMFTAIKNAKEDGVDFSGLDYTSLSFSGFGESDFSLYSAFLIEKLGKYSWFTLPDFNLPTSWKYQPMLTAWKISPNQMTLNRADVQRIADAAETARQS